MSLSAGRPKPLAATGTSILGAAFFSIGVAVAGGPFGLLNAPLPPGRPLKTLG